MIPHFPVSLAYEMLPSPGLALLTLLRRIRSIGGTLKSFILRCLLFFPQVLRSLRHFWPLFLQTSPNDQTKDVSKKKGGQQRPSIAGASGVREGYSTICTSRDFSRAGEPQLPLGPGSAEALPLSPIGGQSQSAPRSPTSSYSFPSPGSPRRSNKRLSRSSAHSIASSHNADIVHSPRPLTIIPFNTPLTLTHSRVTSTQFAGILPSRPRSPSPKPTPLSFSFPPPSPSQPPSRSPSQPPSRSPSPSLYSHPLPQLSAPESSSGSTQISHVISQATEEGSRPSSFDIRVSPPSRSQTLEPTNSQSTFSSPQSPHSVPKEQIPGSSQSPTAESEQPTQSPSDPRDLGLGLGLGPPYLPSAHENTPHNSGIRSSAVLTPYSDQAQNGPSFPQPSLPSGFLPDGRRSIRLMNSEQVSRYVNKGDV